MSSSPAAASVAPVIATAPALANAVAPALTTATEVVTLAAAPANSPSPLAAPGSSATPATTTEAPPLIGLQALLALAPELSTYATTPTTPPAPAPDSAAAPASIVGASTPGLIAPSTAPADRVVKPMSAAATNLISSGSDAGLPWSARGPPEGAAFVSTTAVAPPLETLATGLQRAVQVLDALRTLGSIAQDLPFVGTAVGDLADFSAALTQISARVTQYMASTATPTLEALMAVLQDAGLVNTISALTAADELGFRMTYNRSVTSPQLPLSLGTSGSDQFGLTLDAAADATGSVTLDLQLGTRVSTDEFFIRVADFTLGLGVDVSGIDAGIDVGFIEGSIQDGEIDLSARVRVTIADPNGDGYTTLAELEATPAATLFTLTPSADFSARLPLELTVAGFDLPGASALVLSAANLFSGQFTIGFDNFSVARDIVDVDLDGNGTVDVDNATLVTFGLQLDPGSTRPLRVGIDGYGVELSSGRVVVALLSDPTRRWTALEASGLAGALELSTFASASASGVTVLYNSAALNWTTAIDLDETATTFSADAIVVLGETIDRTTQQVSVAGSIDNLQLLDLLSGAAKFSVASDTVDADVDGDGIKDLDDVKLLRLGLTELNLKIGIENAGFTLSGSLAIVALAATDARRWIAVQASNVGGSLTLPDVEAILSAGKVDLNRASGGATPLNWRTAIDFDATAPTFTPDDVLVDGTRIELTGDAFQVSGELTSIKIGRFLSGSAHFELIRKTIDVQLPGTDVADGTLLQLALSNANVTIGDPTGIRFTATGAQFLLASVTPAGTDARRWVAFTGSVASAALEGITGFTLAGETLTIELNRATGTVTTGGTPEAATAINWSTDLDLDGDGTFGSATDRVACRRAVDPVRGRAHARDRRRRLQRLRLRGRPRRLQLRAVDGRPRRRRQRHVRPVRADQRRHDPRASGRRRCHLRPPRPHARGPRRPEDRLARRRDRLQGHRRLDHRRGRHRRHPQLARADDHPHRPQLQRLRRAEPDGGNPLGRDQPRLRLLHAARRHAPSPPPSWTGPPPSTATRPAPSRRRRSSRSPATASRSWPTSRA